MHFYFEIDVCMHLCKKILFSEYSNWAYEYILKKSLNCIKKMIFFSTVVLIMRVHNLKKKEKNFFNLFFTKKACFWKLKQRLILKLAYKTFALMS